MRLGPLLLDTVDKSGQGVIVDVHWLAENYFQVTTLIWYQSTPSVRILILQGAKSSSMQLKNNPGWLGLLWIESTACREYKLNCCLEDRLAYSHGHVIRNRATTTNVINQRDKSLDKDQTYGPLQRVNEVNEVLRSCCRRRQLLVSRNGNIG